MKKIISIILLSVLIFSILSVNAGAKTVEMADASETDGIVAALNAVEPVKEQMGISEIDFYELTYSDSVSAYDYTKDGLIFNCEFIPRTILSLRLYTAMTQAICMTGKIFVR